MSYPWELDCEEEPIELVLYWRFRSNPYHRHTKSDYQVQMLAIASDKRRNGGNGFLFRKVCLA